jgi:hypothetical protein
MPLPLPTDHCPLPTAHEPPATMVRRRRGCARRRSGSRCCPPASSTRPTRYHTPPTDNRNPHIWCLVSISPTQPTSGVWGVSSRPPRAAVRPRPSPLSGASPFPSLWCLALALSTSAGGVSSHRARCCLASGAWRPASGVWCLVSGVWCLASCGVRWPGGRRGQPVRAPAALRGCAAAGGAPHGGERHSNYSIAH